MPNPLTRRLAARAVAAVAAALVLGLPVVAAPPVEDDFKYSPSGTGMVVVMHLDRVLASPVFKQLRKDDKDFDKSVDKLPEGLGVAAADVDRLTFFPHQDESLLVIRPHKAVKAADVEANFKKPRFEGDKEATYKPVKAGAYTMYEPDMPSRPAFCLVDDRTLLIAEAKALKPVLERKAAPEMPAALRKGLAQVDQKAATYFVADHQTLDAFLASGFLAPEGKYPGGVDAKKMWAGTEVLTGSLSFGDREVAGAMAAACKDDKAAAALKGDSEKVRDGLIAKVKDIPGAPPAVLTFLGMVKPEAAGAVTRGRMNIKNEDVVAIFKAVFGIH